MKIGFLGAGNATGTFGRHLINAGHTVVVSNFRRSGDTDWFCRRSRSRRHRREQGGGGRVRRRDSRCTLGEGA